MKLGAGATSMALFFLFVQPYSRVGYNMYRKSNVTTQRVQLRLLLHSGRALFLFPGAAAAFLAFAFGRQRAASVFLFFCRALLVCPLASLSLAAFAFGRQRAASILGVAGCHL